uniref:Uncharacterized protein n=1 Tax=Arion vulgaris TaxID=1028688 RepID=A0A0B6ZD04_9EUPU
MRCLITANARVKSRLLLLAARETDARTVNDLLQAVKQNCSFSLDLSTLA